MKVYYISSNYDGCNYLRCMLPMWFNGWDGDKTSLGHPRKDTTKVRNELMSSDVIVFHRADKVEHHRVGMELKRLGKKIVFDNDDTFQLEKGHPFYELDGFGDKQNLEFTNNIINNFILNSDLVTCSTEFLKKEYEKINPNVVVLKNYVNPDDWPKPKRNETDKVRIGIVGSSAYSLDHEIIDPILEKLSNRDDIQLVLFGLHSRQKRIDNPKVSEIYKKEYEFFDAINIEHFPWVPMHKYFETLNNLRLDILLIPRADTYFNKCKSNVKFLEAAMCEVPVITNSFPDGPYEKDINGKNGILVKDSKDWDKQIERLIKNKDLRRKMGSAAKKYVLKNYDINKHYEEWRNAYSNLLN